MHITDYKGHILQSWKLAYPIMISQLSHMILGVTDSIMVGHIGSTLLAASALANALFTVVLLFGIGVTFAITPLVAVSVGKAENSRANIAGILRHGLALNLANALLLIVILFFARKALYHLDQPLEVVRLADPYLLILTFSLIPILIFQTFRQFLEGLSNTKTPMFIMLFGIVLNVGLNYLFIYGHAGFPAMELIGAGWGSFVTRIIMALAVVLYLYRSPSFRIYRSGFAVGNYSRKFFKKILHIGLPTGMQFIFEFAAFNFSAVMIGWLGAKALAAHQIAITLASISYMTANGIAIATTICVSYEWGKGDFKALKESFFVLLLMDLGVMLIWGALFVLGRQVLPVLYVHDREVIELASSLIAIAGLFQLSDGIQVLCVGALRGINDVKVPSLLIFIAYWVIAIPLGYWLAFVVGYGVVGIWWGFLAGLTTTAIATFVRFQLQLRRLSEQLP